MAGSLERARAALDSRAFRHLLASRLTSQLADGFFQAFLVARLVFLSAESSGTALGVARAYAVLVIPFSLLGPLAGVFIDRWSRRRILAITPLVRTLAVIALLPIGGAGAALYGPALIVVSLNRFYLSTASAVMPVLVEEQDLLVANSMATVGGTISTFVGIVAGTKLTGPIGTGGLLAITAAGYPLAALFAAGIASPLRPERAVGRFRAELARVADDLRLGARRLAGTPAAIGSIVSVSLDQFLIGFVTVLSLVVFRDRFDRSVASYGNLVAAGGVGVLGGTLSVGLLEERLRKTRIVALAFAVSGIAAVAVAPAIGAFTILLVSFVLGLTFAWRKIPVDTIVQEVVPDRFRGRVFAVYDIVYAMARVLAAAVAVVATPHLSTAWLLALCGLVYLLWTPVAIRWIERPQRIGIRFHAGSRADETAREIDVAGEVQPVEMIASWNEERDGRRLRRLRLRAADGSVLEVASHDGGPWLLRDPHLR